MPISERPYEKCELYGPGSLSDAELIAVVIRTGGRGERVTELAARILNSVPGKRLGGLFQMTLGQLSDIRGVGRVKAVQLICLAELAKRMMTSAVSRSRLTCSEPMAVASHFMPQMKFLEYEQVRLLILNGRNVLEDDVVVSIGTFNSAVASPREIFYNALKHKAVSIIIIHNHPSGDPTPSKEDLSITERLAKAGEIVGIPLLDHIIIGDGRYVSLKESGYAF